MLQYLNLTICYEKLYVFNTDFLQIQLFYFELYIFS